MNPIVPHSQDLQFRFASVADVSALAMLNLQLLRDEGNHVSLSLPELQARMVGWLSDKDYRAVLFEYRDQLAGYALFVHEPDQVFFCASFMCCRNSAVAVSGAAR